MKPLSRAFEYTVTKDGTVDLPPVKDSFIHSADYVGTDCVCAMDCDDREPGRFGSEWVDGIQVVLGGDCEI